MIIKNNEDALRVKCEDVKENEIGDLVFTLENELNLSAKLGNPGIGLAAPQIGIAKKIAIVRLGNISINLVNASIANFYNSFIFKEEGCLSFPGRVENTKRFEEIHVVDNLSYPNKFVATGLLSVVIQHELDHLNSTLFTDHKIKEVIRKKVGPNDLCICGSIKKYKKCCGK
jgi:peptide deformylase